jgi:integrase/recombinase XerD
MATLNVTLDTRRSKAGNNFPIKIRITHLQKSVNLSLNFDITQKEWDAKRQRVRSNHQNHKKINLKISNELSRIQEIVLDLDRKSKPYTAVHIKSMAQGEAPSDSILEYGFRIVTQLKESNRFGTANTYTDALRKLSKFLGNKDCHFGVIDYRMLTNFESFMLKDGLKINSVSVYLRSVRAIFNKAIKEGIVGRDNYPFRDFKIKSERTRSRSMTVEDLRKFFNFPLVEGSVKWKYRQIFFFSFAFIGMSFIDMAFLQPSDVSESRIKYRRRKTGRLYSIAINKHSSFILDSIATQDKFLLPILKSDISNEEEAIRIARESNRRCNKILKRIAKDAGIEMPISTYYARYTWSNVARKLGYSKDMIAEALGHSYGNRMTTVYLDEYDVDVIDEMNFNVLKSIFGKRSS